MTKAGERYVEKAENVYGAPGYILKEALISEEERGAHCRMLHNVTVPAGGGLGYHEHHGETETYYILSGKGIYNDNGTDIAVEAGDVTFCKAGNGHGILNAGEEDLVFVAVVLKE
ncbi:MAG: cupin domain-containing protein [Dorea sp.]